MKHQREMKAYLWKYLSVLLLGIFTLKSTTEHDTAFNIILLQ